MPTVRHLRALQTFDAVARRLNLTHAAHELGVSQSAVSRQIALLEGYLGIMLFRRTVTGVQLTDKGEILRRGTQQSFATLETTIEALLTPGDRQTLTISLPVALATKWFVKRLPLFRAEYPHISVLLDTTDDLVDFSDPAIDAALRFSAGRVEGLYYEKLASERLVPVIAPRLLKSLGRPFRIEDVTEFPILQDDFDPKWRLWMAMVLPDRDLPSKPSSRFRDSAVLIEAAIDGQGVALVRYLLAKDDIAAGRLGVIDARDVDLERNLSLVCRPADRENTKLVVLRKWLRMQLGTE